MTKILAIPGEGERLDRFELVAELASGGMATVYLARLVGVAGFKRFVAIKRLHPHLAKEREFVQMFLDEARLAARLHHPNVVPILEIGTQGAEQYYLVMEYIEGDTVGHLMARAQNVNRKIPVPIVIRIMLDTLTGLHAAHELTDDDGMHLEIVHRDVSPQNILVGIDGVARITDFGVAKAQARLASATQGGQLKGKLAYMSPEQVRGNMTVDRRADVFAAGIVTWELLTAERLFKADGEAETLFKVVAAEVPPIRQFEPGVPPEVEVVVRRALSAHPSDRFSSTADFAEALEQAARTYGLVATVRQTAAFVNEMIGLDISQQRDIVRAWIGRSDVSKSGVARALQDQAQPQQPQQPQPAPQAAPAPAAELSSLVDDDLDMATRVDSDEDKEEEEYATRIQQLPQAAPSGPRLPTSGPLLSFGGGAPRGPYASVPTSREFQPMGSMGSPVLAPMQSPVPPAVGSGPLPAMTGPFPPSPGSGPLPPGATGPFPPGAGSGSYPQAMPGMPGMPGMPAPAPAPKKKGGLPAWTLVVPAVIIIGGAVFLGVRQRSRTSAPPQPAPTASASATATTATTATTTASSPQPAVTVVPPATASAAEPAASASAAAVETAAPPATSTGVAPAPTTTAATTATAVAHPTTTTTHRPITRHVGHTRPSNAAAVDSKEFGGRD
jgi:serine/threonine protein kinase